MNAADKALAAYDAVIFSFPVDLERADLLAAVAIIELDEAAKDKSEPAWYRAQCKENAAFLRTQID